MSHDSKHGEHKNPIPMYIGIFVILFIFTAIEALPLFRIVDLPPPFLLVLSAIKFVLVVLFFMHLLGDHPFFQKVFFIPLIMASLTVAVLMTLFDTWTLAWAQNERGADPQAIVDRYPSNYDGVCNSWINSSLTGNLYCASPALGFVSAPMNAYSALQDELKKAAADPEFDGWDSKSADEKKAVLMKKGGEVYAANCAACHMPGGEGGPIAPPMKGDPVANAADPKEHITILLKGLNGKVINGVTYAAAMPPWPQLTDNQIASVVTYERLSWGNTGTVVEPKQVAELRK